MYPHHKYGPPVWRSPSGSSTAKNPLTARVAHRIIFGCGISAAAGGQRVRLWFAEAAPRNPPLLDWLAVEFMEHGWQMKHIHRLLVTSHAYRMSSTVRGREFGERRELDRDNHYLWRMNTRRMEAELVRDAVFYVGRQLDLTCGGPDIAYKWL